MIQLSKRLQAIADLVPHTEVVADVGTDHAYLPIFLIQAQICKKVLALDINKGPLQTASTNIHRYHCSNMIETRLSDGLSSVTEDEVDGVIFAGMGGELMQRLLTQSQELVQKLDWCIVQPQSQIEKFRRYLIQEGYSIVKEDIVCEDDIYYPILMFQSIPTDQLWKTVEYRYGKDLLENKHPVLYRLLKREIQGKERIIQHLSQKKTDVTHRISTLQEEIQIAQEGLMYYESERIST